MFINVQVFFEICKNLDHRNFLLQGIRDIFKYMLMVYISCRVQASQLIIMCCGMIMVLVPISFNRSHFNSVIVTCVVTGVCPTQHQPTTHTLQHSGHVTHCRTGRKKGKKPAQ